MAISDHAHSHTAFMNRIADVLIDGGHNLTILHMPIRPFFTLEATSRASRIIQYKANDVDYGYVLNRTIAANVFSAKKGDTSDLKGLFMQRYLVCESIVNDDDLLRDLKSTKFDMGIAEIVEDCQEGLFEVLGIQNVIHTSALPIYTSVYIMYGIPEINSFMPNMLLPYSQYMSFKERFVNFYATYMISKLIGKLQDDMTESYRKKYGADFPHLVELRKKKANFVFLNTNEHLDFPNLITTKVKYIGGLENPNQIPISEKLKNTIEQYKGFVVFSFGSLLKTKQIPPTVRDDIISAFKKFPDYAFIWKFDTKDNDNWDFVNGATNIYFEDWLPQIALLNHPKCKAFISHMGYNSFQESIMAGVPIIAVPFAYDQGHNAAVVVEKKLGTRVNPVDLNDVTLTKALEEVLTDSPSIYHITANKFANRMKDSMKIMSPRDTILNYVDYAHKHGSLPDMNLSSNNLNTFQIYLLDIFIPLGLGVILVLVLFLYILRAIFSKITMAIMKPTVLILCFLALAMGARTPRPRHLPRYTFGRPFHGFLSRIEDATEGDCDGGSYQEGLITQPIDHFSNDNSKTWTEYYQYNMKFYDPQNSDLVFFMLGGESPIGAKWVCKESYAYMQWAKKYKAAVFQAEHRFFGKSRPFPYQTVDNLAWFYPEQILADYNNFISQMNQIHFQGKKMRWVLFGGSYPGSLTAWMRAVYPNASIGGVSSSSAVNLRVDYYGYATNMQKNYKNYDATCASNIETAFKKIQSMSFSEDGRKQLTQIFNLCDQFPGSDQISPKDLQFFWGNIFGEFQGINQYSGDNRDPLTATMNLGIPGACQVMNNLTEGDVVKRVANVINWVNGLYGEPGVCMPNKYSDYIATYASPYYDSSGDIASGRSWMWQCCTYLGYFQTTDGGHDNEIWGSLLPMDFFVDQCIELFNSSFTLDYTFSQVEKYRNMFGANKKYPGSKCVFPNGSLDPWYSLGLLEGDNVIGNEVFATTIDNGAHCSDMYPPRDEDSASLRAAREFIASKLDSIIQFS